MGNWIINRTRYAPCYWPFATYFGWNVKDYWGMKNNPICIHAWENGNFTAYHKEKSALELGNIILNKLKETEDLSLVRINGLKSGNKVVSELINLAKITQPSISETIIYLEKLIELYPIIMRDNMLYWVMTDFVLESDIRSKISQFSEKDIEYIMKEMSQIEEKSYSSKEEDLFFEIVNKAKTEGLESRVVKELIDKFTSEYFWFPYEYAGPSCWDINSITARVKNSFSLKYKPQIYSDILKNREKCIVDFKLSEEVIKLFEIMRTMSLMQDDRKMMNSQICYYTNGVVLKKLAEKLGISDRLILYSDIPLLYLAESDKDGFVEKLKERAKAYAIIQITPIPEIVTGEKMQQRLSELGIKIEKGEDLKEIKGSIGYKGVVTGHVRILNNSHVDDFRDGDIIVTGMTTPDFVPLIRKASAIITNEGGITCHAAIVAREMKKPCIIGTKIATKVLKDGDLVEVDANNGIVKILK